MYIKKNNAPLSRVFPYMHTVACILAPCTLSAMQKGVERPRVVSNAHLPEIILLAQKNDTPRLLELLKKDPAACSKRCNKGYTALHWAAFYGHYSAVAHLLVFTIDIHAVTADGKTALQLAEENRHESIVKMLRAALPNHETQRVSKASTRRSLNIPPSSDTIAHDSYKPLSLSHGVDFLLEELEEKQVRGNGLAQSTPLQKSVASGNQHEIQLLFGLGARVYLHARNNSGDMVLHEAAKKGYAEITALLLNQGAQVDALNGSGQTALFIAVANGHKELAKLLLTHNATADIPDDSGVTPLMHAQAQNDEQMCFILENKHLWIQPKQKQASLPTEQGLEEQQSRERSETAPTPVLTDQMSEGPADETQKGEVKTGTTHKGSKLRWSFFRKKR